LTWLIEVKKYETVSNSRNRTRALLSADRRRQHDTTHGRSTDSRLHLGNDPTRLPESNVCKSKMQADFYTVYDTKVDAALLWYGAHLPSFKRTHAYAANRSQDTFYNAEGTISVSVTGSSGRAGENTETYSVVYSLFQPALMEKTIIGLNQQKIVCQ
jgi:hypothetical protein